jgi:hypothetical protein
LQEVHQLRLVASKPLEEKEEVADLHLLEDKSKLLHSAELNIRQEEEINLDSRERECKSVPTSNLQLS